MKKITLTLVLSLFTTIAFSQEKTEAQKIDSLERSFTYERGVITLKDGIGKITVPKGFKYLNSAQAEHVLVDIWGNPKEENPSLGLLLPENQGIIYEHGYVFNIQYDKMGYVEDTDAEDIDYDELLTQMKSDTEEENIARKEQGYEPVSIVGWAAKPFYDADKKILHWAKTIKFGGEEVNTLNYNVRILGRQGVLVLNAISIESDLPLVQKDITKVLDIVQFNKGYKYEEFDSNVDEVAAWTIGGLVAGKVLAKVGIFALIAKFGKIIVFALLGFFGVFKNKIMGFFSKKKEEEVVLLEEKSESETEE